MLSVNQPLQLPLHGAECPAQDRGQPFVEVAFAGLAGYHQLLFRRHRDTNPHAKRIPRSFLLLRFLYGDPTAKDVIADVFELGSLLADERFDIRGFANVAESDLQRNLHGSTSDPLFYFGGSLELSLSAKRSTFRISR